MMEKLRLEKEHSKRKEEDKKRPKPFVKPPFPRLSSLNVTTIVLSMCGYDDEIKDLMQNISKNSRLYLKVNWDSIEKCLVHWPLPTTGLIEFGDSRWHWDPEYPTKE